MVAGRKRDVGSKTFEETVPKLGDELRATIRNDLVGNTVESDMVDKNMWAVDSASGGPWQGTK